MYSAIIDINPLCPCVTNSSRSAKISILYKKGSLKKFPNERRDYESVDEKKNNLRLCPKKRQKKFNSGAVKGY